jgi:PH/SEC7 domain-containing protein
MRHPRRDEWHKQLHPCPHYQHPRRQRLSRFLPDWPPFSQHWTRRSHFLLFKMKLRPAVRALCIPIRYSYSSSVDSSGLSPPPPSPGKTMCARDATTSVWVLGHGKRRSMSVGEVDHMKATSSSLTPVKPPASAREKRSEELVGWDSTMRGILSDFKGELSQFDQETTATTNVLGLRVATGSPQQHARQRIRSAEPSTSVSTQPDIRQATSSPPSTIKPNPTIVAYAPDVDETGVRRGSIETPETIVPPRSPQLLAGATIRASSYSQRPFPSAGTRPLGPRSASSVHTPLEGRGRLLVHPRPTGYNSEPSLIPASANAVTPPLSALSQQDLSTSPSQQFRQLTPRKSGPTDPEELEARGKECAKRAWEEDEEFLAKERIAEWLGGMYVST